MSSKTTKRKALEKADCPKVTTRAKKQKVQPENDENLNEQSSSSNDDPVWSEHELLASQTSLDPVISKNVIKLLEEGNTIPFIARYRRDATGNMTPELLRDVKKCYEEILNLKSKIKTVLKSLEKTGNLSEPLTNSIKCSCTIEELEYIYAPFKPGGKRTLAERAKELGLEEAALNLLANKNLINLFTLVEPDKKELCKLELVEKGIMHIIASVIATNTEVLSFLRKLRQEVNFTVETKKSATKLEKLKNAKQGKGEKTDKGKKVDEFKYETYFNFKIPLKYIKPHQVLAINRGESQKVLSVKIVVPEFVFNKFSYFCTCKWVNLGLFNQERKKIIQDAIQDAYNRLLQPLIIREIRSELKEKAEKASCEVFSTNLKHLLLGAPLKGKPILGIDPGFSNGCKLALVSTTGALLDHNVVYPHKSGENKAGLTLKNMLQEHSCELVALGNGTACRETEKWLTSLIKTNFFAPLNVTYTIVNEDGASIYSCSAEAKKEFPKLDPNIISAVSLARRVQEPLAELVKVEPQHLGVGMYQHDVKKKQLETALEEVVSECVSFVGVDLNTASQCLLRRIAGLSDKKAALIIEYRKKNGTFINRNQLTEIKGIGARIFEQCAGFLRVGPATSQEAADFYKKCNTTKLDCTIIHPESYETTNKVVKKLNLSLKDVGSSSFISKIKSSLVQLSPLELSVELNSSKETIELILDTLCKPLNYDLRSEVSKEPLFKNELTSINDVQVGTVLTGRINNVTHFGCFVDIGVGRNGLIHTSQLNGLSLQIGDRVQVKVQKIDVSKGQIGLTAIKKI